MKSRIICARFCATVAGASLVASAGSAAAYEYNPMGIPALTDDMARYVCEGDFGDAAMWVDLLGGYVGRVGTKAVGDNAFNSETGEFDLAEYEYVVQHQVAPRIDEDGNVEPMMSIHSIGTDYEVKFLSSGALQVTEVTTTENGPRNVVGEYECIRSAVDGSPRATQVWHDGTVPRVAQGLTRYQCEAGDVTAWLDVAADSKTALYGFSGRTEYTPDDLDISYTEYREIPGWENAAAARWPQLAAEDGSTLVWEMDDHSEIYASITHDSDGDHVMTFGCWLPDANYWRGG